MDGTLSESLCQEIEAHVVECSNCRIVVDTLRKTVTLYHTTAVDTTAVPAQVRERLFRTLNLENHLKQ